jgi:hypothetical protein
MQERVTHGKTFLNTDYGYEKTHNSHILGGIQTQSPNVHLT